MNHSKKEKERAMKVVYAIMYFAGGNVPNTIY